jgi:hypothetical protein
MDAPGLWELVSANGADDSDWSRTRRRAPFTPTWFGALGVVVLSLVVDLVMVLAVLTNGDQCGQTLRGLITSSLVVLVLAALPAMRWLTWFVWHGDRRAHAVVAIAFVVAGIASTAMIQVATWNPSATPMFCD